MSEKYLYSYNREFLKKVIVKLSKINVLLTLKYYHVKYCKIMKLWGNNVGEVADLKAYL